jgi:ATP-dependent RNA circularization protein (DNA/RNA ligase family)
MKTKPLGHKSYGSIPHLPGSRRGPADKGLQPEQARILTEKTRNKHDVIYVTEKLDGANVSVAKIDGKLVPLMRAGFTAKDAPYEQLRMFHDWAMENYNRFDSLLDDGERLCGEWLAMAAGTIYNLKHEPFVAFDIMVEHNRTLTEEVFDRCYAHGFVTPALLHKGEAYSIESAMNRLGLEGFHGAEMSEGAVWRLESKEKFVFMGKYVRPEKVDGKYFEKFTGKTVWNWRPE